MKIHSCRTAQITVAIGLALVVHGIEGQIAPGRAIAAIPQAIPQFATASTQVPLEFESNMGQAPAPYAFVAHGPSYSLALSATEVALTLHSETRTDFTNKNANLSSQVQSARLALQLIGASEKAELSGLHQRPGRSNYFIGNDPSKWLTAVPHFGRVKIAGAYPGIDLIFYGSPQQLEYDFVLAPGTEPNQIRLNAVGASSVAINSEGNALLKTNSGEVELKRPVAYQQIDGVRKSVSSDFQLAAGNTLSFTLGSYDHRYPLVVDPVLLYAVALGGSNGNHALGMDLDAAGNAYVTGNSCSSDFPTTAGEFQRYQGNPDISPCEDAFILKLDPTASTLLYSDFFGGTGVSSGGHVAVDSAGNAYVTGATTSADFPLIANIGPAAPQHCPLVPAGFNCPDGFIVKFNPSGSEMLFSSLLGGSDYNGGYQVKLNPVSGDLVVLGETNSASFKPTPNTLETKFDAWTCANSTPCFNSFLIGLDPATGAFRYGTYLGAWYFCAGGLAFDEAGDIFVAGTAEPPIAASLGKPTFTYAPKGAAATGSDIYILKLHEAENKLTVSYSTLIQGENQDGAAGIAVDKSGNAYIVGSTTSLHLPTTAGVLQPANKWKGGSACGWSNSVAQLVPSPCGTGFVAKLGPTGELSFLTYLGGTSQTWGEAIAVDSLGNLWLAGMTSSSDFPFSKDAYSPDGPTAFYDYTPFMAEMSNNGAKLPFASPIASIFGQSYDLRIDKDNNVYVTGFAYQAPSTPGVYPSGSSNINSLFVQKWSPGPQPALQLSSTSLTYPKNASGGALTFPATDIGGISQAQTVTLKNTGGGTLQLDLQLLSFEPGSWNTTLAGNPTSDFVFSHNCGSSLTSGASCTVTVRFQPVAPVPACTPSPNSTYPCYPATAYAEIAIQNNSPVGTRTFALIGPFGRGSALLVSPDPIAFPAQTAGVANYSNYAQSVNLRNVGDLNLLASGVSITGPNAAEFLVPVGSPPLNTQCAVPIASGSSCALQIAFAPSKSAAGTRTATLNIADNSPGSPHAIPLTGIVSTSAPGLVISPTSATVGPSAIGAKINEDDCYCAFFNMTNPSSAATVQVTALTFGGANKGDFGVNIYPPLPATITPGGSKSFEVYFSPKTGTHGLRTASLTLTTSPVIPDLPAVQLQGLAVTNSDSALSVYTASSPGPLDFGTIQVGQTSSASNFVVIQNQSPNPCAAGAAKCGLPLTISAIEFGLLDYTPTLFDGTGPSPCTPPITIPAGGNCEFAVNFSPTKAGNRNTTMTVKSNASVGSAIATLSLMGGGLALPIGNLSSTALNFGESAIKVKSLPLFATLTNAGAADLVVSAVAASNDFEVVSNTCTAPLVAKSSCIIGVAFTPPAAGVFSGVLTVTDNDAYSSKQLVALNGTGASGTLLRISPNIVNFGTQAVNTASKVQTLTLSNTGDTPVTFPENAFRTGGDFSIHSTTCLTKLAEKASCTISLVFKPISRNVIEGILSLTDSAAGSPQPVTLTGTGQ